MGKNILLVDDEKAVLRALQRSLAASRLNLFLAADGAAALDILAEQPIDLIISDMRMPKMDGHQLLRLVKERYPATVRLILSGYSEEKTVTRAMLDGSCKMYLMKPWDNRQLSALVNKLLATKETLLDSRLAAAVGQLVSLPPIVQAYNKVIDCTEADADIRKIAADLEKDQSTAAKIIQLGNQAFLGIQPGSVAHTLSYLGLTALRGVLLAACCQPEDGGGDTPGLQTLWRQSCLVNRLVGGLHRRLLGRQVADAAVAAGLLSDIGRLLAYGQFPDRYAGPAANPSPEAAFCDREQQILGVGHQEIGGYLLDLWNMPQPIIESALYHHNPLSENIIDRELVALVHIADHYVGRALGAPLDQRVFALLGTERAACEVIINEILAK